MPEYVLKDTCEANQNTYMVEVGNIKEMVGDLKGSFAELRRDVVAKTASNGRQNTEIAKVLGRVDALEKEKDAQNKRIAKWVGIIGAIIAVASNLDKIAKAFGG